jgi:hypothetical protein
MVWWLDLYMDFIIVLLHFFIKDIIFITFLDL